MSTTTQPKIDSECFFGRHKFEKGFCTRENCKVDQNNLIQIQARRWFNSREGNTYHSVYVTMPDGKTLVAPYSYGYGDQWMDTALDLIAAHLGTPKEDRDRLHNYLTRTGYYSSYSVLDVPRKKDL